MSKDGVLPRITEEDELLDAMGAAMFPAFWGDPMPDVETVTWENCNETSRNRFRAMARAMLAAYRRATPDRLEVIEECAKVADDVARRKDILLRDTKYGERYAQETAKDAAKEIAAAIRALGEQK